MTAPDEDEALVADEEQPVSRPRRDRPRKKQRYVRPEKVQKWWTTGQLVTALFAGIGIGVIGGYVARGGNTQANTAQQPQAAQNAIVPLAEQGPLASATPGAPAAGADKFGRPPGDPHFGHDHPSQPGAAPGAAPAGAAPAGSAAIGPDGKDSFGRAPGSEHFGHNHP